MSTERAARRPAGETRPAAGLRATVIVPVRNEAANIGGLLDALARQTLGPDSFDVVIADDGSTDAPASAVSDTRASVRVVSGPAQNSYAARNRAAAAAEGPVLVFCDADCRPDPDWLQRGLAALDEADLVAGAVRFQLPERPTIWTLLSLDLLLDQELAVRRGVAVTANLFVRREAFEAAGGFDDTFPSRGDFDFTARCVAAGRKLVYLPEAVVMHPTCDDAGSFLRKIWFQARWRAARDATEGARPPALRLRRWAPLLPALRERRRLGRSFGLDPGRLRPYGLSPGAGERIAGLVLLNVVVPYVTAAAQLYGWWTIRGAR